MIFFVKTFPKFFFPGTSTKKGNRVCWKNSQETQGKKKIKLLNKRRLFQQKKVLISNQPNSVFLLKKITCLSNCNKGSFLSFFTLPFDLKLEKPSNKLFFCFVTKTIERDSIFLLQFLFLFRESFSVKPSLILRPNKKEKSLKNSIFEIVHYQKKKKAEIENKKKLILPKKNKPKTAFFVQNYSGEIAFFFSGYNFDLIKKSLRNQIFSSSENRDLDLNSFSKEKLFLIRSQKVQPLISQNSWGANLIIHGKWCRISYKTFFFISKKKVTIKKNFIPRHRHKFFIISPFHVNLAFQNFESVGLQNDIFRGISSFKLSSNPVKLLIIIDQNITKWDNLINRLNDQNETKNFKFLYFNSRFFSKTENLEKLLFLLKKENFQGVIFMGNLENFLFSKQIVLLLSLSAFSLTKIFSGFKHSKFRQKNEVFFFLRPAKNLFIGSKISSVLSSKTFPPRGEQSFVLDKTKISITSSSLCSASIDYLPSFFSCISFKKLFHHFLLQKGSLESPKTLDLYSNFPTKILLRWLTKNLRSRDFKKVDKKKALFFVYIVVFFLENRYIIQKSSQSQ